MSVEYLINDTRYYTILEEGQIFDVWESPKFTLASPESAGKAPFSMVSSFMRMKINSKLPLGVTVNVYGGVLGSYGTVQSVQGVSYPNFQTNTGITPTLQSVVGGKTQIVYSGPPAPDYGAEFNVISFQQTNTFANILGTVFYRVTFQNTTPRNVIKSFPLDVTFNGAIIASE
jgi:hypothetical protein